MQPRFSVFDRLLDSRPGVTRDTPINDAQAKRKYIEAVIRDLRWLLNSRATPERAEEEHPELKTSCYSYGLPDFSAVVMDRPGTDPDLPIQSSEGRLTLARAIKETIERHEPRLTGVAVESVEGASAEKMKLSFQVEAELAMDPEPVHVSFSTDLELTRGSYEVTGG